MFHLNGLCKFDYYHMLLRSCSLKRDAQIWEVWYIEQGFSFKMIHPAANATKMKAPEFTRKTGWTGRMNEHARDAVMLVFKRYWKT